MCNLGQLEDMHNSSCPHLQGLPVEGHDDDEVDEVPSFHQLWVAWILYSAIAWHFPTVPVGSVGAVSPTLAGSDRLSFPLLRMAATCQLWIMVSRK